MMGQMILNKWSLVWLLAAYTSTVLGEIPENRTARAVKIHQYTQSYTPAYTVTNHRSSTPGPNHRQDLITAASAPSGSWSPAAPSYSHEAWSHSYPPYHPPPYYPYPPPYPYHDHHESKFHLDNFPWGIIALLKAFIIKVKAFGILKFLAILFLKFPLLVIGLLLKIFIILKTFKLLKLVTLPVLLPLFLFLFVPLVPILLAPLLLLPLLLPLLLLLPVPVLAPPTAAAYAYPHDAHHDLHHDIPIRRRKHKGKSLEDTYGLINIRNILESDMCLERIACKLARSTSTKSYYSQFILWSLDKMKYLIHHPKYNLYVDAYKKAAGAQGDCITLYPCNGKTIKSQQPS